MHRVEHLGYTDSGYGPRLPGDDGSGRTRFADARLFLAPNPVFGAALGREWFIDPAAAPTRRHHTDPFR